MSAPRVGRTQLWRLRQSLSERDMAVIKTVWRFRLAGARQLEAIHFANGGGSSLTRARTARRVLERLSADGLLRRLDRRVGGVRAGSASYVYAIGPIGQRLVADTDPRRRISEPSAMFVNHTLAITDVFQRLVAAERSGDVELLAVEAEPSCWRTFMSPRGGAGVLKPDLFVSLGVGEFEHRWFLEVDLGTEHQPALQRKASTYLDYLQSGTEQADHDVFPRVLWTAPSDERANVIRQALAQVPGPEGLFQVAVLDHLITSLSGTAE